MPDPAPLISVVLPVYNEAENIQPCLRQIYAALQSAAHEILVCYDFDADSTLPAIAAMSDKPPTVRLVKNDLGKGVAFAMRAGFNAALGDVVVTTMADLSDPPAVILDMARAVRERGADVVSGSRYMKGGSQTGGPLLKRTLSRLAGLTLKIFAGVNTHDCTNNFRAYSQRFIKQVNIESRFGFELGLELTVKAFIQGFRIDEVPSSWIDRTAGTSRFQLWKWMPKYLHWYRLGMEHALGQFFGGRNAALFSGKALGGYLLTVLGCMAILALRRPGALTTPQFWAEDGVQFFAGQYTQGAGAFVQPYYGYLHLVPRLVAWFADFFPIVHAPLIYNLFAWFLGAGCCAWIVLPHFRHLVQSDARRVWLALLFAALPTADMAYMNITNIQWPMLFWMTLVAVMPLRSGAPRWVLGTAYAIGIATSVLSVVLTPVWLLRGVLVAKDRRFAWSLAALHVLYAAFIWFAFPRNNGTVEHSNPFHIMLPTLFAARVFWFGNLGPYYAQTQLSQNVHHVWATGAAAGVLYLGVLAWLRRDRAYLLHALGWVYLSFASIAMFLLFRSALLWQYAFTNNGERYFVLATVTYYLLMQATLERMEKNWRVPVLTVLSGLLLLLAARSNFPITPLQDRNWPASAALYEEARKTGAEVPPQPLNPEGWALPPLKPKR